MAASITFALIKQPARVVCSAVWHWHLQVSRCRWALSRFCASRPVCSAQRLCSRRFRASRRSLSLRSRFSLFFFFQRQVLLVFVHAVSEDEVGACTRGILVFCFKEITKRYCTRKKFNPESVLLSETTLLCNATQRRRLPNSLRGRGGSSWTLNQSPKVEIASRFVPSLKGKGINII